jgi:MinD superfamily P-loop ATPase
MNCQLPFVEETLCRSCGDCVKICPSEALAMRDGQPWLARPLQCLSCGACALICPHEAITMKEFKPE